MKNISIGLNMILVVAVGILYYLHFKGNNTTSSEESTHVSTVLPLSNAGIVFVNSDSLLDQYEYYRDKKVEFESAQAKVKAELKAQGDKLQQEVQDYQQQAGGMTEAQRAQKEEQLTGKQQQMMQRKDELLAKLDDEQSKSSEELYAKLNAYFKTHNKGRNFNYVLGFQKGGGILFANDSLNITKEVVDGLNKDFKEEKRP